MLLSQHLAASPERTNSPVGNPPILKNVGRLEQGDKHTHESNANVTHQLKNSPSLKQVIRRLQKMETVFPAQVKIVPSPTSHRTTGQVSACDIFKSLQDILCFLGGFFPLEVNVQANQLSIAYFDPHEWHISMQTQVDSKNTVTEYK